MKTVFTHLWDTSEAEVAAVLDAAYPGGRDPWYAVAGDEAALLIEFYRDGAVEDEEWFTRFADQGGPPAVSVAADVFTSSDVEREWEQVRSFFRTILGRFRGVAQDDHSHRAWSLTDVEADAVRDGTRICGHWRDYRRN